MSSEHDTDAPLDSPPTNFDHIVYESLDPPKESEPEIRGDKTGLDEAAAELTQTRAERNEITERTWGDPRDWSKHAPGNRTVSAEHASDMLAEARKTEAALAQAEMDAQLAAGVDEIRGQQPTQPEPPEFQQTQPQPELQPQPEYAPPESNPELDRLLQGLPPEGRAPFLDNYNQIIQQAQYQASAQYGEALQRSAALEKQLYEGVKQASGIAVAGLLAAFPELDGINDNTQLATALQTLQRSNPGRAEQLERHISRVARTINLGQLQAAQEQQRQYAVAQQQRQQQQEAWQRYSEAHDARVPEMPPGQLRAVQNEIVTMAQEHGISKQELAELWQSNPVIRHSAFQEMMRDAALYRISKRSIPQAVTRPIPQVQRPGTTSDESRGYNEYAQVANQYRGKDLSVKDATRLLLARRSSR